MAGHLQLGIHGSQLLTHASTGGIHPLDNLTQLLQQSNQGWGRGLAKTRSSWLGGEGIKHELAYT